MDAGSIALLGALVLAGPRTGTAADPGATGGGPAVLAEWVAAQNAGDFARYGALYAPDFSGIRRSKERTQRFKRDAWLADRKRMFTRPMTVSVADVRSKESAGGIDLTFTQIWMSGSYGDLGKKTMRLERTPAGLRIAREEMVTSWSLPRAIAVDDTQNDAPDVYGPGDTIEGREIPDCDDCSDYDNACEKPRGVVLSATGRGKEIKPVSLERDCDCLCSMHEEDDNKECGCDSEGFVFEKSIKLGDRAFAIVRRKAVHIRTRSKVYETRVSYHLYGALCGQIRELLVLWERDHPTADGYAITATGSGAAAWRSVTVTDRDGPRARFVVPEHACGFQPAK